MGPLEPGFLLVGLHRPDQRKGNGERWPAESRGSRETLHAGPGGSKGSVGVLTVPPSPSLTITGETAELLNASAIVSSGSSLSGHLSPFFSCPRGRLEEARE